MIEDKPTQSDTKSDSPELKTFLEAEEEQTEEPAAEAAETEEEATPAAASPEQVANMKAFGEKLGIDIPENVLALTDNAAISAGLVETAMNAGKTEDEISAAMGGSS